MPTLPPSGRVVVMAELSDALRRIGQAARRVNEVMAQYRAVWQGPAEGQERSSMAEPIKVRRDALIERLNAALAERQQKREADAAKAEDTLGSMIENLSTFERRELAAIIRSNRAEGEWDNDPTDRAASGFMSDPDNNPARSEWNPDADLERSIRALEMGSEDAITLSPTDEFYRLI